MIAYTLNFRAYRTYWQHDAGLTRAKLCTGLEPSAKGREAGFATEAERLSRHHCCLPIVLGFPRLLARAACQSCAASLKRTCVVNAPASMYVGSEDMPTRTCCSKHVDSLVTAHDAGESNIVTSLRKTSVDKDAPIAFRRCETQATCLNCKYSIRL
jgi:hypothetical protein